MITVDTVRSLLNYDPETGHLVWRERPPRAGQLGAKDRTWNTKWVGRRAGCISWRGYVRFALLGTTHLAHRIAWLHFYGEWPSRGLDHINGDPSDNRIANLRLATQTQNLQNSGITSSNKTGFKGVYYSPRRNHYLASIRVEGRRLYLGSFSTPEQAHVAYGKAAQKYFGEFARVS